MPGLRHLMRRAKRREDALYGTAAHASKGSDAMKLTTRAWHVAYSHWYDNRAHGNHRRETIWGWITDRIARWA